MDIAVMVNLRARRGSERVVRAVRAAMPDARVVSTRSLDDALDLAGELRSAPPDLVVSGGGDGTAVALLTAMRAIREGKPAANHPPIALLPLGTGNGWAHAVGAPRWRKAVASLGRMAEDGGEMPLRRFELIEVCGVVAPFAGAGWDATILEDYRRSKSTPWLPRFLREGIPGYALSVTTRSIPRALFDSDPVQVTLENLGSEAMTIDPTGRPIRIPGAGPGTILYQGPVSVCGCGTTPALGFGLRVFPFYGSVPNRFSTRIYAAPILNALAHAPSLFRGTWRIPHDHQWMLDHCRMTFSRPVPFQAGGDPHALRSVVEYKLSPQHVNIVDWRAMATNDDSRLHFAA